MFGDTDNIRTRTEDDLNNTGCYGGFGNRFSYEQCRREEIRGRKKLKLALLFFGVCMFGVSFLLLSAIVLVRVVETNRSLYYPSALYADESHIVSVTELPIEASAPAVMKSVTERFVSVSSEESERYLVPVGVLVKSLEPDSEASSVGIEIGDIIVAVNGHSVSDIETLNTLIEAQTDGAVIKLTVFRDNSYYVLNVNID